MIRYLGPWPMVVSDVIPGNMGLSRQQGLGSSGFVQFAVNPAVVLSMVVIICANDF